MSVSSSKARNLQWFRDRKDRMLPGELGSRVKTTATRRFWIASQRRRSPISSGDLFLSKRRATNSNAVKPSILAPLRFDNILWQSQLGEIRESQAYRNLINSADELLAGRGSMLGTDRTDLAKPNWDERPIPKLPPVFEHQAEPSFKAYWELSRGNILTQLSAASFVSGDKCYADRSAFLLQDWCEHFAEPSGSMWDSGVELGLRLQSWSWMRRLAIASRPEPTVFEIATVKRSITNHLEILLRFPSTHSSANNHRLVEAAGLVSGGCSFADLVDPALAERARTVGLSILATELLLQVSPAGLHREQAVDYHCFALEVAFFALLEAELFGLDVKPHAWSTIHRMTDVLHAICDSNGFGPRFGDGDNSHVVQLDAGSNHPSLRTLTLMASTVGGPSDTRQLSCDIRAAIVRTAIKTHVAIQRRSLSRPPLAMTDRIALAREGLVVTQRPVSSASKSVVWLSLRSGPLGYLPIAAHAHADLNTVEMRLDGIPFFVDPATYLYGEDPVLRRAFRETRTHSTVTVDGQSQAEYAGAFLWSSDALGVVTIDTFVTTCDPLTDRPSVEVGGFHSEHNGYTRLPHGPHHRRSVALSSHDLTIIDTLLSAGDTHVTRKAKGESQVIVQFLIGQRWVVDLRGTHVTATHGRWAVEMDLDPRLAWTIASGAPDGTGWEAPTYGWVRRAVSLQGTGRLALNTPIETRLQWDSQAQP